MCSEYQVKTSPKAIENALGIPVRNRSGVIQYDVNIRMGASAPAISLSSDGEAELTNNVFPVSPFPNARLSGFENQTDGPASDNDPDEPKQVRRIYDVPRWKADFKSNPMLVPMTSFTEFAYWGPEAGHALAFAIPDTPIFFAAAIAIKPYKPKTGHHDGFALLTHTATEQMLKHHQRLLVLLKPERARAYLEKMTSQERFEFLIENRFTHRLNVHKIRNMAKGWEKRVGVQELKLKREQSYRRTLQAEHVPG